MAAPRAMPGPVTGSTKGQKRESRMGRRPEDTGGEGGGQSKVNTPQIQAGQGSSAQYLAVVSFMILVNFR